MPRKVRTVLIGLGNVNRGVLHILSTKEKQIAEKYDLRFEIVAVADSAGVAVRSNGFKYDELLKLKSDKRNTTSLPEFLTGKTPENISQYCDAELLIEASPANLVNGNPGLSSMRSALRAGWHVVTANKAPLVFDFDGLHELASQQRAHLAYSATVCGGLPVVNVLKRDLKLASLLHLKGIFNATSNFVLAELEKGNSMKEAVLEAQRIGAAETDPTLDLSGRDAANKLYIIMKSFTDFSGSIDDISIQGIQNITVQEILDAEKQNKKIKLVATAEKQGGDWKLNVSPTLLDRHSTLANCEGWEMGLDIKTDLYDFIHMKIYEADPTATAAAVVRDCIDVCTPTANIL